eukprot:m.32113 g.32113  ORF g.32113 m.32113 type:complete len:60 (+) comp14083_c0_seq1:478-657(+)
MWWQHGSDVVHVSVQVRFTQRIGSGGNVVFPIFSIGSDGYGKLSESGTTRAKRNDGAKY